MMFTKLIVAILFLEILLIDGIVSSSCKTVDRCELCFYEYDPNIGYILCGNRNLTDIPTFNEPHRFDHLKLDGNGIASIKRMAFNHFESLRDLYLDNNAIESIQDGAFEGLSQLEYLHLENNRLSELRGGMFRGLSPLDNLYLSSNIVSFIEPGTFQELTNLTRLDLDANKLTVLTVGIFNGLSSLYMLTVAKNELSYIEPGTFSGLDELGYLHLQGNKLSSLSYGCFFGLSRLWKPNNSMSIADYRAYESASLREKSRFIDLTSNPIEKIEPYALHGFHPKIELYSNDWKVCCIAAVSGTICKTVTLNQSAFEEHLGPENEQSEFTMFSSCEDLLHNIALRYTVWILGLFSVAFNLAVILWRSLSRYKTRSQGHNQHQRKSTLLATCLAFGDLCMGIFLLIIATADQHFRGYYILQDENWRNSVWCQLAGFLSALSSEFSVFILTLITVDRYWAILHPISDRVLNFFWTKVIVVLLLVLTAALAAIPLMIPNFSDFYNRTGVCLALPLSVAPEGASNTSAVQEGSPSWTYSFSVFIGLNSVSVVTIIFCYARIFWQAVKSSRETTSTTRNIESRIGGRIMMIISTDMACWLPVIVLGFLSILGHQLPPTVYAWLAVFVLPINSAINPLIYTFYTKAFQKAICTKYAQLAGGSKHQDSIQSSTRTRDEKVTKTEVFTVESSNLS